MFSMFSPDSRIMQVLTRITDLILLNIVYFITCIPVITIGAANAALYSSCFRLLREEDSGIIRNYFRAFKENFKQGTVLWLIILFAALPGFYYFDTLYHMEGMLRYGFILFLSILVVVLLVAGYAFPWVSRFRNTTREVLMNSLILSVSHLPRSILISVLNVLPWALLLWNTDLFMKVSFLWLVLYFAAAAYMNASLLLAVFKPYLSEEIQ